MNVKAIMVAVAILCLIGAGYVVSPGLKEQKPKFQEDIDAIYELIAANNNTQHVILDNQGRLMHYIAGHDFEHFVNGCPECGLLEQLSIRKQELYDEITELTEFVMKHPDDASAADKTKLLNELQIESSFVTRYIASSQDRAKQLGKIMMKRLSEKKE